jgi:hypothetical protein
MNKNEGMMGEEGRGHMDIVTRASSLVGSRRVVWMAPGGGGEKGLTHDQHGKVRGWIVGGGGRG